MPLEQGTSSLPLAQLLVNCLPKSEGFGLFESKIHIIARTKTGFCQSKTFAWSGVARRVPIDLERFDKMRFDKAKRFESCDGDRQPRHRDAPLRLLTSTSGESRVRAGGAGAAGHAKPGFQEEGPRDQEPLGVQHTQGGRPHLRRGHREVGSFFTAGRW